MVMRKFIGVLWLVVCCVALPVHGQQNANARQARQMFDEVYQNVFGPKGSTLHYAVNIIGIYKTEGTIWYKGKKSKFQDEKYNVWCDGKNYWMVNRKKRTVTVYDATSEERDKYATKFTFSPDNYNYSIKADDNNYIITLKAKKNVKGIKEAVAYLNKRTRHPERLRIKVGIFHTTIRVSNFRSGNVSDAVFVFPQDKYKGYQLIDKRNK